MEIKPAKSFAKTSYFSALEEKKKLQGSADFMCSVHLIDVDLERLSQYEIIRI